MLHTFVRSLSVDHDLCMHCCNLCNMATCAVPPPAQYGHLFCGPFQPDILVMAKILVMAIYFAVPSHQSFGTASARYTGPNLSTPVPWPSCTCRGAADNSNTLSAPFLSFESGLLAQPSDETTIRSQCAIRPPLQYNHPCNTSTGTPIPAQ